MQRKSPRLFPFASAIFVFCVAACMASAGPAAHPDIVTNQTAQSEPDTGSPEALPLKGRIVAINAGHNTATNPLLPNNGDGVGTHSGADTIILRYPDNELAIKRGQWKGVIRESDLTQDLAERVSRRLEALGARTVMTRIHSTDATPSGRQKNLDARVERANKAKADILIDLHANYGFRDERGFMLFIPATKRQIALFGYNRNFVRLDEKIHTPFREARLQKSLILAKCLYAALSKSNPIPPFGDGLFISRFHVIGQANMPSVLIECGFMNIPTDMRALAMPSYRDDFAVWIGNAVCAYFGK